MLGDDPTYTGMDISTKSIVCTTLDENGNIMGRDSFEKLGEFLGHFSHGDSIVMESTGFYEPLYDFIESHGFSVKVCKPNRSRPKECSPCKVKVLLCDKICREKVSRVC